MSNLIPRQSPDNEMKMIIRQNLADKMKRVISFFTLKNNYHNLFCLGALDSVKKAEKFQEKTYFYV